MKLTVKAPAKINLHLDILGRLNDGYHSLFMIMQTVSLFDIITVEKGKKGIDITCSNPYVPPKEKNIAYKAAECFFKYINKESCILINIEKNIPLQAGLAGGSADAAGVLVALNRMFGECLNKKELCSLGLKIGSDVPFSITGGTCISQNRGGILSPIKDLGDCFIILAKPEKGVSTKDAFEKADNCILFHPDNLKTLDFCEKGDFEGVFGEAANVFEQIIEVPERVEIKRIMREYGCTFCRMTGSGPTVFGIFKDEDKSHQCCKALEELCPNVFVTKPIRHGATIIN
ncbi:MAG: 4-(cytidine 5'-diphospho)-2-C-methyl-D-erythritol kinase [Clostridiales bacterium]|nr:4-(cytidine 5'-diphospho)-2-C-methyl-D-erythritol kinase [Clostridiales bacterium]